MVKVSIIVPVYNVEKYLGRCLKSLVNQTLKDIEIICINDGSTDLSEQILDEYTLTDSRIIVLKQEQAGQSAARNRGMEIAKGKYIGFVDSDDWVDKDFFENLYNSAVSNNADIAAAGIVRLNKYYKKCYLKFNKETITCNTDKKFELCDVPAYSYVCNKIYKKELFSKNNLQFEEGIYYEDVIITPQLLYYSKVLTTVPDTYYYYWRNSNSTVTKRNKKHGSDSIYAHKKALDFINSKNIDITSHKPETYRLKVFGMTIFKIRKKGNNTRRILFNVIKW